MAMQRDTSLIKIQKDYTSVCLVNCPCCKTGFVCVTCDVVVGRFRQRTTTIAVIIIVQSQKIINLKRDGTQNPMLKNFFYKSYYAYG